MDSGSLTSDTEIERISHCGAFYLDGRWEVNIHCLVFICILRYVSGCITSCSDMDGCDTASRDGFDIYRVIGLVFVCFCAGGAYK